MTELQHNTLLEQDNAYRDLFFLHQNLGSLLNNWVDMPMFPLEPKYRAKLGDADYIIGNFSLKKIR